MLLSHLDQCNYTLHLSISFSPLQVKQSFEKHKLILLIQCSKPSIACGMKTRIFLIHGKVCASPRPTLTLYRVTLNPLVCSQCTTHLFEAIIMGIIFVLLKLPDDCFPHMIINSKRTVTGLFCFIDIALRAN